MLRISRYTIRFTQFNYQFNLYLAMPHCYCIIYLFIWYLWYTYILYIIFFFTKHLLKKTEMFFFEFQDIFYLIRGKCQTCTHKQTSLFLFDWCRFLSDFHVTPIFFLLSVRALKGERENDWKRTTADKRKRERGREDIKECKRDAHIKASP